MGTDGYISSQIPVVVWCTKSTVAVIHSNAVAMQIDLRFGKEQDGALAIVVAPVLRFLDVGFNADVRIKELGSPEKLIGGFGPELFGSPLQVCFTVTLILERTFALYLSCCMLVRL